MTVSIATCLWFDRNAEDAVNFYASFLDDLKIGAVSRYGKGMPLPEGTILTIAFEMAGQHFTALNGGPMYKFSEAISIQLTADTQEEVVAAGTRPRERRRRAPVVGARTDLASPAGGAARPPRSC
jgi:predicted 3-demethylubiquinone-9 3-methyltransferase (glyoxalase superfamily)